MRVLLDTHVLLWAAATPERLGASREVVERADVRLLSAASVWELAIEQALGKVDLGTDVSTWARRAVRELAATSLDVTARHAAAVEELPPVHRDPVDRLLVAQAQQEHAVLLTADATLADYGAAVQLVS